MNVQKKLFELSDKEYAAFQAKLIPGIDTDTVIGVRVPEARKLAREYIKEPEHEDFLKSLPHRYYDENILHGILISEIGDYEKCIEETERFLPFVDNWAVCDIMSPKAFKKNREKLLKKIKLWTQSTETYIIRFGLEMLMTHFLDEDFKEEYLEIPAGIISEEYYVNMMIAWLFATALAKQWVSAVPYLEKNILPVWVHNKTIQKARESYRIKSCDKEYLKGLKR